jgi:hypothetical protein
VRITLNNNAKECLLTFMHARGIDNPTHGLNMLISEATLYKLIPAKADVNGSSQEYKPAD